MFSRGLDVDGETVEGIYHSVTEDKSTQEMSHVFYETCLLSSVPFNWTAKITAMATR